MSIEPDPEGYEIEALRKLVALDDKQVLEIGCGDGRLTVAFCASVRMTALTPGRSRR